MSNWAAQIRSTLRAFKFKYLGQGFSESGEDLIARYLIGKTKGKYVDIGAGNPVVGSNTFLFYKMGWDGVAVDPNMKIRMAWKMVRPRDVFLPVAVGSSSGQALFYEYENDLRSTTSQQVHKYYEENSLEYNSTLVEQRTLTDIFETYVKDESRVFLSIDVEGQELEVLQSLDFKKFTPSVIAIENWNLPWDRTNKNDPGSFLEKQNYKLTAYSGLTAFYVDSKEVEKLLAGRPKI